MLDMVNPTPLSFGHSCLPSFWPRGAFARAPSTEPRSRLRTWRRPGNSHDPKAPGGRPSGRGTQDPRLGWSVHLTKMGPTLTRGVLAIYMGNPAKGSDVASIRPGLALASSRSTIHQSLPRSGLMGVWHWSGRACLPSHRVPRSRSPWKHRAVKV